MSEQKLTRILSIDGGGIRGIIPGQILVALEKMLQEKTGNPNARIGEYFDLIAGTSTGGILACLYLCPDSQDPKRPRFSAEEAVGLYMQYGGEIFDASLFQKMKSMAGVSDEKYSEKALENILTTYFGDTELKDLIKPCLISAYDVHDSKAVFFTQQDARKEEGRNFYVRDVARATSAAPTYFEAAQVISKSGVSYPLIDGGVFANNPALCAYAEARHWDLGGNKIHPKTEEMMILSIGNGGSMKMRYEYEKVKDWGIVEWIQPLISIMMSGVDQTVDFQLRQIFQSAEANKQYIRITPELNNANALMDDASEENLAALKEAGTKASEQGRIRRLLERAADLIIENHH